MIGNDAVQNLVGAALLIRTFVALRGVDPGFDAQHIDHEDVAIGLAISRRRPR
jgi:hypothetical protein